MKAIEKESVFFFFIFAVYSNFLLKPNKVCVVHTRILKKKKRNYKHVLSLSSYFFFFCLFSCIRVST